MQVLARKDGYVVAVAVKNGDLVNAGAVIIQMDTTQEDLNLARIAAIDSLRSIFAKRLASPAVDLTRRLTQIAGYCEDSGTVRYGCFR
jgi:multidrug efflux pump subunit AcrA (membrane-fusion protein)